jgi:hypothetical protein
VNSLLLNDDILRKLVRIVDDGWVSIEEIEDALGIRIDLDMINKLSRSGLFEVMYSTLDNTFYIRRKAGESLVARKDGKGRNNGSEDNGGGKLNLQVIVDEIRKRIHGMIPKPEFEDWLASRVPNNWHLVYNQLLNDGVIEEVVVSGMMFVKIVE